MFEPQRGTGAFLGSATLAEVEVSLRKYLFRPEKI